MTSAFIICDLGLGDAGKGTTVDWLARAHGASDVVRYNGGAQAAHNVISPDGRHHTFAQFGAGTFIDGVRTHLSRFSLVDPLALTAEEAGLQRLGITDAWARLSVDPHAIITTPFHVAANRLRERARGAARHGSCGMGIGETMIDALAGHAIRAGDLRRPDLPARLAAMQARVAARTPVDRTDPESRPLTDPDLVADLAETYALIAELIDIRPFAPAGTVIFEGAQGVLLDENVGFHPHTTWSTTTPRNARALARDWGIDDVTTLGVLRTYATRHGAGPLPTEAPLALPEAHNATGRWQGAWRVGYTDPVLARYAAQAAGPLDGLIVTCVDRLPERWQIAEQYLLDGAPWRPSVPCTRAEQSAITRALEHVQVRYAPADPQDVPQLLADACGVPLWATSHGPTAADKRRTALVS